MILYIKLNQRNQTMLITIENLDFSYGIQNIFHHLSFTVQEKEKIGLIGDNGCGKTTFLKLINGELFPDSGKIHFRSNLSLGYLAQENNLSDSETLHTAFLNIFKDLLTIEEKMTALQNTINTSEGEKQKKAVLDLGTLQEIYEQNGGYEYPSRIRGIANGLGFTDEDLSKPLSQFSGGQKTRINLGCLLLKSPDILLLDEPTNYLDFSAITWLESFLRSYDQAFIVISHDRYFLDNVCHRIAEVEDKHLMSFVGNYSQYYLKKQKYDQAKSAEIQKNNKEIARQQQIIDQLRARHSVKSFKRAKSRETKLEKINIMEEQTKNNEIHLSFSPKVRSSDDVLSVKNLFKAYPNKPLLNNLSFNVFRCDKIGIIGPNGIGKSTLFKILMKQIRADSGNIHFGQKVRIGYYSQESTDTSIYGDISLIDAIWSIDSQLSEGQIRNLLARFLFKGDSVFKTTESLSGGEMARLRLAMLMVSDSNFLLLDEPTNHIDMTTKEILENALIAYEGTVMAISHDRYFLNKIANRIFAFSPGCMQETIGNYEDYYEKQQQQQQQIDIQKDNKPEQTKTQRRHQLKIKKQTQTNKRKQKNKLKNLETEIEKNDQQIANMELQMCDAHFYDDINQAKAFSREYQSLKEKSATLLEKWENLAVLVESDESD